MAPYGKPEVQFSHDTPIVVLRTIAEIHIFPLLVETVLLAIFTVQTIYFAYHRWTRVGGPEATTVGPAHRRGSHANLMMWLAVLMYLLVLAYWSLDVVIMQQELMVFWPELLSETAGSDPYQTLTLMLGSSWYTQAVLQGFIWTIGDAIALWRAYVVHSRARWLGVIILFLLLTELGVYSDYLLFYTHILPNPPTFIQHMLNSGLIVVAPYLAAASITVVIQVFATTMIACKAWTVWKRRKCMLMGPGKLFRTLAVFIESGLMYTLFWVWYILATNDNVFTWEMTAWTEYYSIPLMAMYPTLVVMIIAIEDSSLTEDDNFPDMDSQCREVNSAEKADSGSGSSV